MVPSTSMEPFPVKKTCKNIVIMEAKHMLKKEDFTYTKAKDGKSYIVVHTSYSGRHFSAEVNDLELIDKCRSDKPTKNALIQLKRLCKGGRR